MIGPKVTVGMLGAALLRKEFAVTGDANRYAELADRIEEALNRKWLNRETHQYATGSQTANLLPLALQIVPKDQRAGVLANIVKSIAGEYDGHLHTGNTGTRGSRAVHFAAKGGDRNSGVSLSSRLFLPR